MLLIHSDLASIGQPVFFLNWNDPTLFGVQAFIRSSRYLTNSIIRLESNSGVTVAKTKHNTLTISSLVFNGNSD